VAPELPPAVPGATLFAAFAPPVVMRAAEAVTPAPAPALAATVWPEFAPTAPADAGWPETATAPGAAAGASDARRLPAAPPAAVAPVPWRSAPHAPHAPPSAAPAPTEQRDKGGPTGGDVFLDGSRVGVWLADHLARETGRPQAGGTGFDPRLTAAWPGSLQGG
jgi:hypothetical protein